MTVVNGIEIDRAYYKPNEIKMAIENNDPIEQKLNVILVVSNPCLYARRYLLMKEFLLRFENEEPNVIIYIVELAYGQQRYYMTESDNPRHLQLRTDTAMWHKENMINLGVKYLLPVAWKAFAWIDADLEFLSPTWAMDTLRILNGSRDIVQLFNQCIDMDAKKETMQIVHSAGFQYCEGKDYHARGNDYWHPGYAWAITRKAYEKIGGLYEMGILGSGDYIMQTSILGKGLECLNKGNSEDYKDSVSNFQKKIRNLRFGYVPGTLKHYFHGHKKNRKYTERWKILIGHGYSPYLHLVKDSVGLLVPGDAFPEELKSDIMKYFMERNEDEDFEVYV